MTNAPSDALSNDQKANIRRNLIITASKLIGIPYKFGAEWKDFNILPDFLDCSELVENVYLLQHLKMPDGSQNQYDATLPTKNPKIGDLAFFGRGGNPRQIYHVGLVFDDSNIIESRGKDESAKFETGKVILRPRTAWEKYVNFVGYSQHFKLI